MPKHSAIFRRLAIIKGDTLLMAKMDALRCSSVFRLRICGLQSRILRSERPLTHKDGDEIVLKLSVAHADYARASPREVLSEVRVFVQTSLATLAQMSFKHNIGVRALYRDILFERARGQDSSSRRLLAAFDTFHALAYPMSDILAKLEVMADELAPSNSSRTDFSKASKRVVVSHQGSGGKVDEENSTDSYSDTIISSFGIRSHKRQGWLERSAETSDQ